MRLTEFVSEEWSQKYKSNINCSRPKGFSQKAHCAGKRKHNESAGSADQAAVAALQKKHGWSTGTTGYGDLYFTWQGNTYVFYGERVRITLPDGKSVAVVWGQKPDWHGRPGDISFAQAVQQKYLTFDLPIWQALDRRQINDGQAMQQFKAENERQAREAVAQGVAEGSDKKEATRRIQKMLNKKFGANLDVDGVLGPLTLKSINKFMPDAKISLADDPDKTTAVQGKKVKSSKQLDVNEGPIVPRIVHPGKISIYLRIGAGRAPVLVATDIPYAILDKYIEKVIQKYPQFKPTDFSFKSSDAVS